MSEYITCQHGNCARDGDGTPVPEENFMAHQVKHVVEDVGTKIKADVEAIVGVRDKAISEVQDFLKRFEDRHATPTEMLQHAGDCPDCQANLDALKERFQGELVPAAPPATTEEVPPAPVEAPPVAPVPKRLTFESEDDIPGSSLDRGAFGVEAVPVGKGSGVQLRVRDEDAGLEAVEAGAVPKCRWIKGEDGEDLYACEEE